MPYFAVAENFAMHPKVMSAGNAAVGLWVRAGAWSVTNLTDGFVPFRVALQLGSRNMCNDLVDSELWMQRHDGYQFHDWGAHQFTKEEVEHRRASARRRKAKQRQREVVTPLVTRDDRCDTRVTDGVRHTDVTASVTPMSRRPSHEESQTKQKQVTRSGYLLPSSNAGNGARSAATDGGAAAINACNQCDEQGYRNGSIVCDHVDRAATTARGMQACRDALKPKPPPPHEETDPWAK